jgi:hypothetical protein
MGNALQPILGAVGAVGGLGQMNASRNAAQQQQGMNQMLQQQAGQQQQMFQNNLPGYNQVLDFYSNRAGLGGHSPAPMTSPQPGQVQQQGQMWKPTEIGGAQYHGLGSRLQRPGGQQQNPSAVPNQQPQQGNALGQEGWGSRRTGGASDAQMGIWNNPEDRMRLMAAQDDIDRYQQQQGNQLKHNLGQRGMLDSGAYGAGLARQGSNALQSYADFRRQMAIGAGTEEERRIANFMNALAPGMNMAQPAANTFSQLGQQAGQQQQQSNQSLQGLFQMMGQMFGPQPGQASTPGISPNKLGSQMRW